MTAIFIFLLSACASKLSPITNAMSAYDIYSVARDERGIFTIAKDKFSKLSMQAAISKTKNLSNWDIDVEVFYSQMYIIGLVKDEQEKQELISLAKKIPNIKKIHTYIRIKRPHYDCSHIAIFSALKANLFTDKNIKGTGIRLSIVGCDVVFSGVVSDLKQEAHAIWYATHTKGVQNVYSFLQVLK